MAKIIALDIGGKRTGLAETDPLHIIASPRETVETSKLIERLREIFSKEDYEKIVVGDPMGLDGGDSDNSERVRQYVARLRKEFRDMEVILQDERFSSKLARKSLLDSGMKKKKRRQKGEIDKVSAAIILQDYLGMS